MHSDKCGYCGKWVCHKPLLGTLHFCLTDDERRRVDHIRWQIQRQKEMVATGRSPYADIGVLNGDGQ